MSPDKLSLSGLLSSQADACCNLGVLLRARELLSVLFAFGLTIIFLVASMIALASALVLAKARNSGCQSNRVA